MKKLFFVLSFIFYASILSGGPVQTINLERIEPSLWWTGMRNPHLQLLVHGANIGKTDVQVNIPGVMLTSTLRVTNPDYLFVNLIISDQARAGDYTICFTSRGKVVTSGLFQLRDREPGSAGRKGFDASDMIYLIMPDRFANGDTLNDNVRGMLEKADRSNPYGRHGGDLKGIEDHLDYISGLGATALWLTPILENNQFYSSYHGYSITDFYKVDPRFGSNQQYAGFIKACHAKGIKVIMDMVLNHCGSYHWWMKDLPSTDWINQFPDFTRSNYRGSTLEDIHAAKADRILTTTGWFDSTMPDLNLANELMLTYLIQNSIWWVEFSGIDGIRVDTYTYPDKEGMVKWVNALMEEYPSFTIVGEVWFTDAAKLAYWQKDAMNRDHFNSGLPAMMDFPLAFGLLSAFNEEERWDNKGLLKLYDLLADDFLYPNPDNLVVLGENHDLGRLFEYLGKDIRKFRMAMAFLATVRGIPQLYYGSEILMDGDKNRSDPEIRKDFPGGWPGDTVNAFVPSGRTDAQNEAVNYISALMNYRKNNPVLQYGKLVHFIPENNVYVYFRILDGKAVMVLLNNAEDGDRTVNTVRFSEVMHSYTQGLDIVSGTVYPVPGTISVPAKSALILEH